MLLSQRRLKFSLEITPLRYPEILEAYPAALLIGDEALLASQQEGLHLWDLGEAWSRWTRLPFVFALWVVRRRVVAQNPDLLHQLAHTLGTSYQWSARHPKELIAAMRKVFPWEVTFLIKYLAGVSYDLDEEAWAGLTRFAQEGRKRKLLPEGAARGLWALAGKSSPLAASQVFETVQVP